MQSVNSRMIGMELFDWIEVIHNIMPRKDEMQWFVGHNILG